MSEPKHFNTADWPWHLSCAEIGRRVGLHGNVVRHIKAVVFGLHHLSMNTKWEEQYGHLGWKKFDYSKTNDSEIARQLGVSPSTARNYRMKMGLPTCYTRSREPETGLRITKEQIDALDWEKLTDVEIGRKHGFSREYARQLRLHFNKPRCLFHRHSGDSLEVRRWLHENRDALAGKHISEITKSVPGALPEHRVRMLVMDAGIPNVDWSSRVEKYVSFYEGMNWDLPNVILATIWGSCSASISNNRHQHHRRKSKWHISGFSSQRHSPEFRAEVIKEISKAIAAGVSVNANEVLTRKGMAPLQPNEVLTEVISS